MSPWTAISPCATVTRSTVSAATNAATNSWNASRKVAASSRPANKQPFYPDPQARHRTGFFYAKNRRVRQLPRCSAFRRQPPDKNCPGSDRGAPGSSLSIRYGKMPMWLPSQRMDMLVTVTDVRRASQQVPLTDRPVFPADPGKEVPVMGNDHPGRQIA